MRLVYENGEFRAYTRIEEKDIPKGAGFRWCKAAGREDGLYWFTDDPRKAAPLIEYAEGEARQRLEALAKEAQETFEASRATDADIDVPSPDGLEYMPFQKAGIAFGLKRANILIGDEMGLGKTIQAIGLINATKDIQQVLVISPAGVKLVWDQEFQRWLTRNMTVGVATSDWWPATDIVIINYDILHKHEDAIRMREWDMLIVDECHYVKNPKTRRSKQVDAIRARRNVYMTGTPIVNRPVELWPIIHKLDGKAWRSFWQYVKRYCDATWNGFGWDFRGHSNLEELQGKLRSSILIRRLKEEVLKELPPKVRQVIELPANGLSGIIQKEQDALVAQAERLTALKAAVELAKAGDDPEEYREAVEALRRGILVAFEDMARVRHDTAVAKVPYVVEHARNALESGSKIVVFAHHHDVVDALEEEFEGAVVVTGRTPTAKRQALIDRFQSDDSCRVFIGSITAAGVGITLTAASHVIFAELDWVPGNVSQAEDRCHRIGQQDSVLVQHLVLEGSLDAHIAKTLVQKQAVIDKALDSETELITEPIIPLIEEPATSETTRERLEKEAPKLAPEQVETIHTALRMLAAMDIDHASQINQMGFNKLDTAIGHSLAEAPRLTPKQAALGRRIVLKYHRQLPEEMTEIIRNGAPS